MDLFGIVGWAKSIQEWFGSWGTSFPGIKAQTQQASDSIGDAVQKISWVWEDGIFAYFAKAFSGAQDSFLGMFFPAAALAAKNDLANKIESGDIVQTALNGLAQGLNLPPHVVTILNNGTLPGQLKKITTHCVRKNFGIMHSGFNSDIAEIAETLGKCHDDLTKAVKRFLLDQGVHPEVAKLKATATATAIIGRNKEELSEDYLIYAQKNGTLKGLAGSLLGAIAELNDPKNKGAASIAVPLLTVDFEHLALLNPPPATPPAQPAPNGQGANVITNEPPANTPAVPVEQRQGTELWGI